MASASARLIFPSTSVLASFHMTNIQINRPMARAARMLRMMTMTIWRVDQGVCCLFRDGVIGAVGWKLPEGDMRGVPVGWAAN